jgi:hypothetical protein
VSWQVICKAIRFNSKLYGNPLSAIKEENNGKEIRRKVIKNNPE